MSQEHDRQGHTAFLTDWRGVTVTREFLCKALKWVCGCLCSMWGIMEEGTQVCIGVFNYQMIETAIMDAGLDLTVGDVE